MKELLKTLTENFSPSGYEQAARDDIREQVMPLAGPRVAVWMTRTAEDSRIPFQREVLAGAGADAHAIQLARGLGIPRRYVHSPSEMVDMDDLENAAAVMTAMLSRPDGIDL